MRVPEAKDCSFSENPAEIRRSIEKDICRGRFHERYRCGEEAPLQDHFGSLWKRKTFSEKRLGGPAGRREREPSQGGRVDPPQRHTPIMKVVIVYASSGAGHQKAAEAVFKVLHVHQEVTTLLIDSLEYTTPLFRLLYPRLYLFLVRHLPLIWGFFYDGLNFTLIGPWLRRLRRGLNAMNGGRLEDFFLVEKPDVIVSTHFFATEVASQLKKKGKLKTRLITIITDLVVHSVWMTPHVDEYVVGSMDTQEALMQRGVSKDKIALLGIPFDPIFEKEEDRARLSRELGIASEKFTVLVASGGFGVGPIGALVSRLSQNRELQLLVVCGRNRSLYRRLASRIAPFKERVFLYGFVDNIHELMSVSDCMVSKSGGLTLSEALAKKLPIFILYPIPGQETGNRDVLVRHRAAIPVKNIGDLEKHFEDLNRLRNHLTEIKSHMETFRQPRAAERIAAFILEDQR